MYVVDHVQPGETLERRIEVSNGTDQVLEPELYVAPATIEDGSFGVGLRSPARGLARWGRVVPDDLRLAPGTSEEAVVTIAVPRDAEPGEYYGGVVAEVRRDDASGVAVATRVAIRIYLAVGSARPATDFRVTNLSAGRDDGRPVVHARVQNTGQRALDLVGELELRDGPGESSAGPFAAEAGPTVAIGQAGSLRVVLPRDLPAGPWTARLTVRSGGVERVVEGRLRFPSADATGSDVPFEEVEPAKGLPAAAAGLLLFLVFLGLLFWLWKRRRDRRADPQGARTAQVRS